MSSQELRASPIKYTRNSRRRKIALNVDLNVAPPIENVDQEGTSANAGGSQAHQQGASIPNVPIDLEEFDDDVVLSSPRAFLEAKDNARRKRRRALLDHAHLGNHSEHDTFPLLLRIVEEELSSRIGRYNNRGVSEHQQAINLDLYVSLEGSSNSKIEDAQPPPQPPPKEPTFTCPVCMGPLFEEMSTKCGHIFCKACIKAAIAAQGKCPTCRRKVSMKDTIRIYLPAANS